MASMGLPSNPMEPPTLRMAAASLRRTTGLRHAVLAGGDVTVSNGSGTIQANGVGGIGIASTSLFGVATVTNGTGTVRGNAFGIQAKTVTVTANDGTIEAIGTNGRAINATGGATSVTNGTGTIQATARPAVSGHYGDERHGTLGGHARGIRQPSMSTVMSARFKRRTASPSMAALNIAGTAR